MREPGPLRRVDDRVLPYLQRFARWLVGVPGRALRWEHGPTRPAWVGAAVARPGLVAAVAAAVAFAGAVVHLERYPDVVAPSPPPPGDVVAEVGPRLGDDVPAYVASRHEALAGLVPDGPLRAVVSFVEPLTATDLPLPPTLDVEVLHLVVPAQELTPRQVPAGGDPVAAVDQALADERVALDEEIADLVTTLEEDLGDADFERDYRERLTELEAVHGHLEAGAPVVFAAVVVADTADLQALVGAPRVRLVDAGGPPAATANTRFHALLPADRDRASTGRAH